MIIIFFVNSPVFFFFYLVTHTPTLQGFCTDAHRFTQKSWWSVGGFGVGGANQPRHHPTHPANHLSPNSHPSTRTQPRPCKVSVPTCIALQRKRSQDYCWNAVKIEEAPTEQPNAVKSLINQASVTLLIPMISLHFRTEWYEESCMHRSIK